MAIRIADNMAFEQVQRNLQKNRGDMSHFQNQAATQKRVTKPSDDPVAASRVLASKVDVQGIDQYTKNLDYAKSFLEFTDQSLDEVTGHLVRAKELAISQSNDASANEKSRRVVATEIQQIYKQLVKVGNRKLGDRFIFGGYSTTNAPFTGDGKYHGDSGEMLIHVDKGSFLGMNIPGNKVFHGVGLSGDGIAHAAAGQPTTIEELLIQEGREGEYTEIDDREEFEAKQRKARSSGGALPIRLRGPASGEAEAASVTPNELDGRERLNDRGGINVFNVIKKLEVALKTDDKYGVQESLDTLDRAIDQVVLGRAQVGSRVMIIDTSMDTLQKNKVDNKVYMSQLEDADAFQVISDINKTEGTLKATLQTSGKLILPSLLDFVN